MEPSMNLPTSSPAARQREVTREESTGGNLSQLHRSQSPPSGSMARAPKPGTNSGGDCWRRWLPDIPPDELDGRVGGEKPEP